MKNGIKKLPLLGMIVSVLVLAFSSSASAHVVVSPKQVLTAERATFAVSVPNEHDSPVVVVRLVIPEGLASVRPYAKQGWNIEVTKTGEGENTKVTEIVWTSVGADVPVDLKDDFLFGAKAPEKTIELKWKAYETYADGRVVGWEQEPSEAEDSKPYSVTKVISETAQDAATKKVDTAAAEAEAVANRSLYIAVAGVIMGLVAIFLATRRK